MKKVISRFVNRETIMYLIFGVGTTIVNFGSFTICQKIIGQEYYLISNIVSFIVATGFAFVTNKLWVFGSKGRGVKTWLRELISFVMARITTFAIVEELGLWLMVNIVDVGRIKFYGVNGILLAKIFLAFAAVLVNYVLSKVYVFSKKGTKQK